MKRLLVLLASAMCLLGQSAGVGNIWTFLGPITLQNGATSAVAGTAMSVAGLSSATFNVNCSVTCAGGTTITFQGSSDGTNYASLSAVQIGTSTISTTVVNQASGTITLWQVPIGSLQLIRANITTYSSGTITVTATASAAPYDPKIINDNLFIGGTTVDGNSGNKSAQTMRMVIATDQPQLTNKLLVTPDSVALPANQSVNAAQVAGNATDTNSGAKSAGTLRVVLATDQPALTNKLLVTPDSVALPANQSVNVAQVNGVTTLMGNGTTGTGSQRVTIASDNTAFSVNATLSAETTKVIGTARLLGNGGATVDSAPAATAPTNTLQVGGTFTTTPATLTTGQAGSIQLTAAQNLKTDLSAVAGTATSTAAAGVQKVGIVGNANVAVDAATGAAPPANAILHAGLGSGATGGFMLAVPVCDTFQNINHVTAATFLEVTGVSGRHVRICSINMVAAGADNVAIISGTGATCGTGSAAIVGTTSATGYNFAANGGIAVGSGLGTIMRTVAAGDSVCIITSAAVQLSGVISYVIY